MTKQEQRFVDTVLMFYKTRGRHDLPWRQTTDPYSILVSELMLQQTQVERVIPKYHEFLRRWPTVEALARARLSSVLKMWQGLGYNRRAKYLHQCAKAVVQQHQGVFPQTYEKLILLPGVGPYTAGAILAFAFNTPVPLIETNVRTVFIHHFFRRKDTVTDKDIMKRVIRTLPKQNVRRWYAALMDYGTYLKKEHGNLNRHQSAAYIKQTPFKGSRREVRGKVLRTLSQQGALSKSALLEAVPELQQADRATILKDLVRDGLIGRKGSRYALAT